MQTSITLPLLWLLPIKQEKIFTWIFSFTNTCLFYNIRRILHGRREIRNFVSPSGHVMFYLLYKHQWNTKPFHFNSFLEWKARLIIIIIIIHNYYVAIVTVIFSQVKITCYLHVWRYHVFVQKLTWYFIGVYMYLIK